MSEYVKYSYDFTNKLSAFFVSINYYSADNLQLITYSYCKIIFKDNVDMYTLYFYFNINLIYKTFTLFFTNT